MARFFLALVFSLCCLIGQLYGAPGFKDDEDPIVVTPSGSVRGVVRHNSERPIYTFLGIPFAQPPVGDLRFAAPVPAEPWEGIYNATKERHSCIQISFIVMGARGDEDCLYLNVYTPLIPTGTEELLPVNVFIYGGAYFQGDTSPLIYGPERFLEYDMILVVMNYRLGALGYLGTNDAVASGNFGMLDQVQALRWVQDNIAAFGGDKNRVTLSGESAGSSSVIFHVLSPLSAGLFQQAVAESGSAICPWAGIDDPLYYAKALGDRFDCPLDDTTQLIACLREQDAGEISNSEVTVMVRNLTLSYVPTVENPDNGVFLWEDPTTLLEEGRFNKVPILMGINRDEGGFLYIFTYVMMQNVNNYFFDTVVPEILTILTDYRHNLRNVSYAIKDEYYAGIDVTNKTQVVRTHIDLLSDMFMKPWVAQTVQLISAQDVAVYMYHFVYVSSLSYTHFTGEPDVDHASELKYLFNMTIPLSPKDSEFQKSMIDLWANFIIQGNPTPEGSPVSWTPTPPGGTAHLMIDEEMMMMPEYNPDRLNFWKNVVPAIVNAP